MRCKGITKFSKRCAKTVRDSSGLCSAHQDQPSCPICLEQVIEKQIACGHSMHKICMSGLMELKCPLCRSELTDIPQELHDKIVSNARKLKEERETEERDELIRRENGDGTTILNWILLAAFITDFGGIGTCECERCQHQRMIYFQRQFLDEFVQ